MRGRVAHSRAGSGRPRDPARPGRCVRCPLPAGHDPRRAERHRRRAVPGRRRVGALLRVSWVRPSAIWAFAAASWRAPAASSAFPAASCCWPAASLALAAGSAARPMATCWRPAASWARPWSIPACPAASSARACAEPSICSCSANGSLAVTTSGMACQDVTVSAIRARCAGVNAVGALKTTVALMPAASGMLVLSWSRTTSNRLPGMLKSLLRGLLSRPAAPPTRRSASAQAAIVAHRCAAHQRPMRCRKVATSACPIGWVTSRSWRSRGRRAAGCGSR